MNGGGSRHQDKKLFGNARSANLQSSLERIVRNSMKEAHERVKELSLLLLTSEQLLREWKVFLSISPRKPSIDGEDMCKQ